MKFDIKIMGEVFESDDNGFLDLNNICKGCNLGENNLPSEWRGKVKDRLIETANLRVVTLPRAVG